MIFWANLDQEARWSGLGIPAHVARRISSAASLLVALSETPVEIFAPAEVDPSHILFAKPTMRVGTPAQWDRAWCDPAAKHVNDRRFALPFMPDARAISSIDDMRDLPPRWVAKAVWSAAGRDRAIGEGEPTGELRGRIARLIARAGAVVVEPWRERVLDFGLCGAVDRDGKVTANPPHTLRTDARGQFLAIDRAVPKVEIERTFADVGVALARAGYAGPFGIDGFVHTQGVQPLCEINARYTFGHVCHALGVRVLGFGDPPPGARLLVAPPFTAWALD